MACPPSCYIVHFSIDQLLCAGLDPVALEVLHASGGEVRSGSDFLARIRGHGRIAVSNLDLLVIGAIVEQKQRHLHTLPADFESRLRRALDETLGDILARIQISGSLNTGTVNLGIGQVDISWSRRLGLHGVAEQAPAGAGGQSDKGEDAHRV